MTEMNKEQAKQIIQQMYAQFKGTMQDHQKVQQAMTMLFEEPNEKVNISNSKLKNSPVVVNK